MQAKPLRTIIITPPINNAGVHPLSNLIDIMSDVSDSVSVITGTTDLRPLRETKSTIRICKIPYSVKSNSFAKILNHVYLQLVMSRNLVKFSKQGDSIIYYLDSHAYILPVLTGWLLRKKMIFLLAASLSGSAGSKAGFFSRISIFSESLNFRLADQIIVYSPVLIEMWNLQRYAGKIHIAHEHFLFPDAFRIKTNFNERLPLIGYIGRLSGEKGVDSLVRSLPLFFSGQNKEFHVLIGGDGPLRSDVEKYLAEQNLMDRVTMTGWISHDDLPDHLNRLRLLIIPSYSEGLPNIMLEAMACGTPVLATPVGAITDIIKDGETGFIMENNTPACIAENINRVLKDTNLEKIAADAKKVVEENFTFGSSVKTWKILLEDIDPCP
jgi:glycosyltransferase involved in cell wall biosynthesis